MARGALPGSSVPTLAATVSVLVVFDLIFATALLLVVAAAGLVPVQLAVRGRGRRALARPPRRGAGLAGAGYVAVRVAHRRLRLLWDRVRQGGAILRTPGRYLRRVALVQAGAWCCRIAVVLCLLAGFGLPASIPVAGVVMVMAGASTLIPLAPGGAGAQQIMVAFPWARPRRPPRSSPSPSACRPGSPRSTRCSASPPPWPCSAPCGRSPPCAARSPRRAPDP